MLRPVVILGALLISSTAFANANTESRCDGWRYYGTSTFTANITRDLTVTLNQVADDGTLFVIETQNVVFDVAGLSDFDESGLWSETLSGTYLVEFTVLTTVYAGGEQGTFQTGPFTFNAGTFECTPPPPGDGAPRTPGYWKNHPENWPVDSLSIGGTTYSQSCLLDQMDNPTRGDARVKLIHHLIAAKLNLLPNPLPTLGDVDGTAIAGTIADADAYLAGTTIECPGGALSGKAPKGAEKNLVTSLKTTLDIFNNGDLGSSSSALTAEGDESGGCNAVSGTANAETFFLAFFAVVLGARRRRRR